MNQSGQHHPVTQPWLFGPSRRFPVDAYRAPTALASNVVNELLFRPVRTHFMCLTTADDLNFELLSHISPIGWDNVLLYGEYQLNRSLVRSERLSVYD